MKLNIDQLKLFKAKSSALPTNPALPVLNYLKFEPGKVTKSGLMGFITMDISCDGTMLVDEKQLMAFVNYTRAIEIELTVKGNSILIQDGTQIEYTIPTEPIENFPKTELPGTEWTTLDKELLADISIASEFSIEDDSTSFKSNVFIANGMVAACDNYVAFIRPRQLSCDIILGKLAAYIVGQFEGEAKFNELGSYYYFSYGNIKYGFLKPSINIVNFSPFIVPIESLESFVINKKLLISINELAINRSPLPYAIGALSSGTDTLNIEFNDSNYELSLKESLPCTGSIPGVFNYNAAIFNKLLKSIPGDTLRFTSVQNKLYVTDDNNNFVSLIMQIAVT